MFDTILPRHVSQIEINPIIHPEGSPAVQKTNKQTKKPKEHWSEIQKLRSHKNSGKGVAPGTAQDRPVL